MKTSFFACCNERSSFALFIVCDGMGGAQSGQIASEMACRTFVNVLNSCELKGKTREELTDILCRATRSANKAVYEKSIDDVYCAGMGTTLVAALVYGNEVLIVNVGDSRAYHLNASSITQITVDHSLVEDMVRNGEITRQEAKVHPQRNLITRAIGTEPGVYPDVFHAELKNGDYILLCSDGLTNVIEDNEIRETIARLEHQDKVCEILLQATYSRGAPDNVTIVLFKY